MSQPLPEAPAGAHWTTRLECQPRTLEEAQQSGSYLCPAAQEVLTHLEELASECGDGGVVGLTVAQMREDIPFFSRSPEVRKIPLSCSITFSPLATHALLKNSAHTCTLVCRCLALEGSRMA